MEKLRDHQKKNIVQMADKQNLYKLVSFLDSKLPSCCGVHFHLLAQLWTTTSSYKSYFISSDDGEYSAIVAIREERMTVPDYPMLKVWLVSEWTADYDDLITIFKAIDCIDWDNDIVVVFGRDPCVPSKITEFFASHNRVLEGDPCMRYFVDRASSLNFDVSVLDDVYVKSLEREHAQAVYDNWPYKESTTIQNVIEELIEFPSAGLFLKENDQLVCWMMGHPPNGMSRLHTLEEHRRKGYASYVTKYMSKRMAQCGYLPFVNIVVGNDSSIRCFEKTGFRLLCTGRVYYTGIHPTTE